MMNFRLRLENKKKQIQISSNLRKLELLEQRRKFKDAANRGVPAAQTKLNNCEHELGLLESKSQEAETKLIEEIDNTQLGPVTIYVRAFVTPSPVTDVANENTSGFRIYRNQDCP